MVMLPAGLDRRAREEVMQESKVLQAMAERGEGRQACPVVLREFLPCLLPTYRSIAER